MLSGGAPGPHKIQGIGAGFVPPVLDRSLVDEIVPVDDEDALETARLAAPAARACWPGSPAAPRCTPRSRSPRARRRAASAIAVVLPDSGERYVSTPFFAPEPERAGAA